MISTAVSNLIIIIEITIHVLTTREKTIQSARLRDSISAEELPKSSFHSIYHRVATQEDQDSSIF